MAICKRCDKQFRKRTKFQRVCEPCKLRNFKDVGHKISHELIGLYEGLNELELRVKKLKNKVPFVIYAAENNPIESLKIK